MIGTAHGRGGVDFVTGRQPRHLVGDVLLPTGPGMTLLADAAGSRFWLASGYRQSKEFMRDKRFSRAVMPSAGCPVGPALRMSITEMDPPAHTSTRNLVCGAFSARQVERLRPGIEELADRMLSRLVDGGRTADLIADFCAPLTFNSQCTLLGVPAHYREAIRQCSVRRVGLPGASEEQTHAAELLLHDAVVEMVADQRRPPTGLLATLIAAHRDRRILDEPDLTGLAASLFFDGHVLSAAQIANTVLVMLTNGMFGPVRANPALLDDVIEESLRFCPSVNLSMPRVATVDLTLDGAHVRTGDRVAAAIALANRDDAVFSAPEEFLPGRPVRHLTFGYGTHHCIGAHLARVQLRAALLAVSRHAPNLRLATPEHELAWFVSPTIRRLTELPVRW